MSDHLSRWRQAALRLLAGGLLACLCGACSDDATEQNALVAPAPAPLPGLAVHDTLIYAVRDSSVLRRLAMDGPRNLVGAGGGYSAVAFVQFTPGNFPARDTVRVLSAMLRLFVDYRLGNPGDQVDFNVYRLNWQWGPSTVTWDTAQSGLIDRSLLRGHFRGAVASDSSFITVQLDTVMVREWLRTTTSTDVTKFGIALVPTSASGTVIGFQSFTNDSTARRPLLTIIAGNTAGTTVDTSTFVGGIDTFAGDALAPADPAAVMIQAGVVRRGFLAFDLSFLSRGTVVNSAELQVDRLPAPAFVSRITDSVLVAHLATGTDLGTFETSDLALRPVAGSASTLAGDIRHIAQSWVGGLNYGLVLRPDGASEFGSFDLFRLHGVRSASPALRPRLHLTYTVIPLGRPQ